jgi:hypothetical protein
MVNLREEEVTLLRRTRVGVVNEARGVAVESTQGCSAVEGVGRSGPVAGLIEKLDLGEGPMSEEQLASLREMLSKHQAVFQQDDDDMGSCDKVRHTIPTTDDVPVRVPYRRIPPHLQPEVRHHLEKWLRQGVIRPSASPYASQLVLAEKKDGSLRLCVDYRLLNRKTRRDAYPLPRIDEALESLKGARFFSSMDLASGYLQCAMEEADIPKTAFRAGGGGLFEFTKMPFGLCNAPATFQRLMELCLGDKAYGYLGDWDPSD